VITLGIVPFRSTRRDEPAESGNIRSLRNRMCAFGSN
jgi:hypothetical protein